MTSGGLHLAFGRRRRRLPSRPAGRQRTHADAFIYYTRASASSPLAKNYTHSHRGLRPLSARSMSKAPGDTRILTHVPRTLHGGGVRINHTRTSLTRLSRSLFGVSCARAEIEIKWPSGRGAHWPPSEMNQTV